MRIIHVFTIYSALLCAAPWGGVDPVPQPKTDPIHLPVGPIAPPSPQPTPSAVTALGADQIYVIGCDVGCRVFASPSGIVAIAKDAGPVRIRGKFVDGLKTESRVYKEASVYTVEAIGAGRVELIIVPDDSTMPEVRRTIDVGGQAPTDPKPIPTPPKPLDSLATVIQETVKADKGTPSDLTSLVAALTAQSIAVDDEAIKTSTDLYKMIHDSTTTLVGTRLSTTRKALGAELGKVLPADPTVILSKPNRADAKMQLTRFASILDAMK